MPGYAIQQQNSEQLSLLSAYFRQLYNPTHALADAISMILMFPGLRGFWPGSLVGPSGEMNDLSGNGLNLTNNSNALFNYDGFAPYVEYDGTADYHSHVDAADFDILGTEAYISNPGLTMGGWFYFDTPATNSEGLMSKVTSAPVYAYFIQKIVGAVRFAVSVDGSALKIVNMPDAPINNWMFLAGRFNPSTEIKTFSSASGGLNSTTNTTSIPASIFNNSAPFTIGVLDNTPTQPFDGRASLAFLCASVIPDSTINIFFEMTAPLYQTSI